MCVCYSIPEENKYLKKLHENKIIYKFKFFADKIFFLIRYLLKVFRFLFLITAWKVCHYQKIRYDALQIDKKIILRIKRDETSS